LSVNTKKRTQKKETQRAHFRRRMYQRHGWRITNNDIEEISRAIREGESVCLGRQSLRVTLHRLTFNDKEIVVVYDTNRNQPVTVLADDMTPQIMEEAL